MRSAARSCVVGVLILVSTAMLAAILPGAALANGGLTIASAPQLPIGSTVSSGWSESQPPDQMYNWGEFWRVQLNAGDTLTIDGTITQSDTSPGGVASFTFYDPTVTDSAMVGYGPHATFSGEVSDSGTISFVAPYAAVWTLFVNYGSASLAYTMTAHVTPASPGSQPPGPGSGPSIVSPVNGQTLGCAGAYVVTIDPIAGASGYLYGFLQAGKMIWENYRDEGHLSGTQYAIQPGTTAHAAFIAGPVQIWVRGYVNNQWTDATIITITLSGPCTTAPTSGPIPPTAPTSLSAKTINASTVRLRWKYNPSETVAFEAKLVSGSSANRMAPSGGAMLDWSGLKPGHVYCFKVRAIAVERSDLASAWSRQACARTRTRARVKPHPVLASKPTTNSNLEPFRATGPCPKVVLLGARGSGEKWSDQRGLGGEVGKTAAVLAATLARRNMSMKVWMDPYPADPVDDLTNLDSREYALLASVGADLGLTKDLVRRGRMFGSGRRIAAA